MSVQLLVKFALSGANVPLVAVAQSARNVNNRKRSDAKADDADKEFPRVMFLMCQWFMSSKDLAELFMDLYPS